MLQMKKAPRVFLAGPSGIPVVTRLRARPQGPRGLGLRDHFESGANHGGRNIAERGSGVKPNAAIRRCRAGITAILRTNGPKRCLRSAMPEFRPGTSLAPGTGLFHAAWRVQPDRRSRPLPSV